MIKCSECGYENMDGLDYCDGCGAKLTATGAGASQPEAGGSQTEPAASPGETAAGASTGAAAPAAAEVPAGAENSAESAVSEAAKAPTGEIKPAPEPPPVSAALFKAKLSITRGGRRGQEFELEGGNNLIGRWDPETGSFPEVDLDADDPEAKISRKHALIRIEGGRITVEDIGSLNGTYVNRQPRLQPGNPVELKDGDEVIIGKTFLKLTVNPIS